jgi:hypothetical protein
MSNDNILVNTRTLLGVTTGPGPLTSCQSLTWTYRRDAAGEWSAVFAASDPDLTRISLKNTDLRFFVGGVHAMTGPVERVRRSIDGRGRRTVIYGGRDMLGELAENSVHTLELSDGAGAGVDDAHLQIIAAQNSANRTWGSAGYATTLTNVYKRFAGETALAALIKVANEIGEHFRADTGGDRNLAWTRLDTPDAPVRLVEDGGALLHQNEQVCVIESLVVEEDAERMMNRIYPFGAGNADARLDLSACTRVAPTGYTLNTASNYIQFDAGLIFGIQRELEIEFKDIGNIENTDADLETAANALFDAALTYLQRNSDPQYLRHYRLTVRDLPDEVVVGMKIPVHFQAQGELIDQELIITEITRTVDGSGRQPTRLIVVPYDWYEMSEAGRIAQGIERARTYSSHPQVGHNSNDVTFRLFVGEDQADDKAEARWWFGDEVIRIRRMLMRFVLNPLVTFASTVGGATITSESGGGATETSTVYAPTDSHSHALSIKRTDTPVGYLLYVDDTEGLQIDDGGSGVVEQGVTTAEEVGLNHDHDVDIPAHTHDVDISGAVSNAFGLYRETALNTFDIDDLEFRVNALSWADLNTADAVGGGWYAIDITALVSNTDTRRPLEETNTIEVRRKTTGATGKTAMLDVTLNVVAEIQSKNGGATGAGGGGGGTPAVIDHGTLIGLADDDHSQYHNDTRADTWLETKNASDINIQIGGTPTRDDLQDYIDTTGSKGRIDGGVISDAGGETIDVTAGEGYLRATDDETAPLLLVEWSAALGLAIPTDDARYVYVEYNAGTPQVVLRTSVTDSEDEFILGYVVNEASSLDLFPLGNTLLGGVRHLQRMVSRAFGILRSSVDGGIQLGETGTRNVTVTAGVFYLGVLEFAVGAFDTSVADTFVAYYRDGVGGFTKVTAQTQWDNDSYDDGSGVLATMTVNRYGVLWVYEELDGNVVMLYGTSNEPTQTGAKDETPPTSVPLHMQRHAVLIGRIIYQKSAATATVIQSAFVEQFGTTPITTFLNLSDTPSSYAGTGDYLAAVNSGETALEFVELGAKVAAATEKMTPIDADNLALADSAALNVLKRLTWANLKATLETYFDGLYLVLLGVAGGQTWYGGTAASESATIEGTAHATKGPVKLNPSGGGVDVGSPSASLWGTNYDVVQTGQASAFVGLKTGITTYFSSNAYYDGTNWRRKTANPASLFLTASGAVSFLVTATGAADSIITWTTAWTMDNSGQVGNITPEDQMTISDLVSTDAAVARFRGNASYGGGVMFERGTSYRWWTGIGGASGTHGIPASFWGVSEAITTLRLVIAHTTGFIGNMIAPQGQLHLHDGTMGGMYVSKTGIVGSAVTIIPNGAGDVVRGIKIIGTAYETVTPSAYQVDKWITPGGSTTIDSVPGGQTLTLACAADGSVTVQRTAGTATWSVGLQLVWL